MSWRRPEKNLSSSGDPERTFLADTDLFFFFLRGGELEAQAKDLVEKAERGEVVLRTSSEVYDDASTALRSKGHALELAQQFVSDMRSVPHTTVAMTAQIASDALSLYAEFGGRGRLSYFDSFHVATAKSLSLRVLTSDGYINRNAGRLGIEAVDLAKWRG